MKGLKRLLAAAMAITTLSYYPSVLLVMAEETDEPETVEETPVVEEAPVEEEVPEPVVEEPAEAEEAVPEAEPAVEEAPAEEPAAEEPVSEPAAVTVSFETDGFGYVVETNDAVEEAKKETYVVQTVTDASQFVTVWAIPADGYEVDYWEWNGVRFAETEKVKVEAYELSLDQDSRYVVHFRKQAAVEEEEERLDGETEEAPAETKVFKAVSGNNVVVEVTDSNNAFPEGTTMTVAAVPESEVIDAVNEAVEGEVKTVKAVDITFFDADGNEIEPAAPVTVSLKAYGFTSNSENQSVVHIDDNNNAEVVADAVTAGSATTAEFETEGFSIYIVVETGDDARILAHFNNGDTEIDSVYVKKGDNMEQVVYDPSFELEDGVVFMGWTTEKNYTSETLALSIANVRDDLTSRLSGGVTDGTEVTYYAMLFNQYDIVYLDETGTALGEDAVYSPTYATDTYEDYTVYQAYTPADDEHDFQGWNVIDGSSNIDGYAFGKTYKNNDAIKVKGSVTFSVNAPEGHWLIFDENGKGATYNAPQFVLAGENTVAPTDPTRPGYTFGGWYTDTGCSAGNEFTFGGQLTDKTIIYAKWEAEASAPYTVIIWKQNVTGNDYDFEEAIVLNGTPGTVINTVVDRGTYAQINGKSYIYGGFSLSDYEKNVVITPEGNAVLDVYYDRNEYTLTFQRYSNGQCGRTGWQTVYTIKALYGQPIGYHFPIHGEYLDGDERWAPQNGSTFSNVLVYIDVMPAENVTFHENTDVNVVRYMEFYVEALPGQTPDRYKDGIGFVKHGETIPAKYNYFTEAEDFIEMTGFEKYASEPAFNNQGRADVPVGGTLRLFYTREEYSISFMDGVYTDSEGNPIEEPNKGLFKTVKEIKYEQDITSYNEGGDNYYKPTAAGYVFKGWYVDESCTKEAKFDTMPSANMTVYAKWVQTEYRVFLHPNVPSSDTTLDWGSAAQQMTFRTPYGGTISTPYGLRKDYTFVGWYLDEGLTKMYPESYVLNESTVTTPYDKTTHMTTPMDKYGEGATTNEDVDRFWIEKEFNLYAKWRKTLDGADGINVVYDVNGGSGTAEDKNVYVDGALAYAVPAVTPPEGKKFAYWELQKWNGSAYTDKVPVYPGQSFEVLAEDAKVESAPDSTPDKPHNIYTVQLKAVYVDIEEKTPTHIYWYSNYGSENEGKGKLYRADDPIDINEAVDIYPAPTREGNKFLGWTKKQGGTTADFLVWNGTNYTSAKDGKTATQVAADEDRPEEDLFAVWEKSTFTVTWKSQDGTETYETDKDVAANTKPSYDGDEPTKAKDSDYYYTFEGWATETDSETGTAEGDLPEVTDDVTYYAAFSKHELLTVKFTIKPDDQNGKLSYNGSDTLDGVTVNGLAAGDPTPAVTPKPNPGYEFKAWEKTTDSGTTTVTNYDETVTENVTYAATWKPKEDTEYKVNFWYQKLNSDEYELVDTVTRTGTTGETVSLTAADETPARENYDFNSTKSTGSRQIAGDGSTVLDAYFWPSYKITFLAGDHGKLTDAGGTETEQLGPRAQRYGEITWAASGWDKHPDPGYVFDKWDPAVAGTVTGDATYTAQWKPNEQLTYTVTYTAGTGGTVDPATESDQVLSTENIKGSKATPNTGYAFDGWYKGDTKISDDATLSTAVIADNLNKDDDGLYDDTEFTAKFVELEVTIKYVATTGGSVNPEEETVPVITGTPEGSTATPDLGYVFVNWTNEDGEEVGTDPEFVPTENVEATYTANFKELEATITYEAGTGGSVDPEEETVKAVTGTPKGSTATPDDGYRFVNWTDEDGQEVGTDPEFVPTEKVETTYTANFEELDVTIKYVATTGGKVDLEEETIKAVTGTPEGSMAEPLLGYLFVNWTDEDGKEVSTDLKFVPTENVEATYTANFKEMEITFTYVADIGGSVDPEEEKVGIFTFDPKGSTATPDEGYEFVNWTDEDGNTVSIDPKFVPDTLLDAVFTAHFQEKVFYYLQSGDGNVWTKGTDVTSDFVYKRSVNDAVCFDHFTGIVIDGAAVDPANYTAESGSTVVKLLPKYLETLSVGEHSITAQFDDGNDVDAKFIIKEPDKKKDDDKPADKVPDTSDHSDLPLWASMFGMSALLVAGIFVYRRKEEQN